MRLIYAYAGFSMGVALYFLVLMVLGLRAPDIPIGAVRINLFVVVAAAFVIFTLYVVYRLTEKRS